MNDAMKKLRETEKKLYALGYAMNVIEYDNETVAPSDSSEGRGEALAELNTFCHQLMTDPALPDLFAAARSEERTEQELAEIRDMEKDYNRISKIPAPEYSAYARLTSSALNAWGKAKAASDFSLFAPYLEQIVETKRRFAGYFAPEKAPYDVLLDQFETGLTMEKCDRFFGQLNASVVPLLKNIMENGKAPRTDFLTGPWDTARQDQLSDRVMELMQIDRRHCQRGLSEHPFTTEFYKGDVRITTNYNENDMTQSLYSVIHEGGHALYELHIDDRLKYTCLAGGSSMGVHEGQSRMFENYIGRSLPFIRRLMPILREIFPEKLGSVSAEDFYRAVNTCRPSLIRTEADEVTYSLHIMVRYELEKQLIGGTLQVKDLPEAWNEQMKKTVGVTVPNDREGVLQDIHWAGGDLGYFPSYALGTAYSAQIMANMRKTLDVDSLLEAGDLAPIIRWLTDHIWRYGREKEPEWLIENACGAPFDPRFVTDYLTEKYTEIYQL